MEKSQDIKEAWDATLNEDAQKRSDEIMVTMSEEIEALAKKDKDEKDAEKESNEIEQILTAQMAAYKEAMDNTFTAIMEGTDE